MHLTPTAQVIQTLGRGLQVASSELSLLPAELAARSLSEREIVLAHADAMAAIDHLASAGRRILAWEGWLRWPDGRVGHSGEHQGTVDLSGMTASEAAAFCRETIALTQAAWDRAPEVPGATLYFCITITPT